MPLTRVGGRMESRWGWPGKSYLLTLAYMDRKREIEEQISMIFLLIKLCLNIVNSLKSMIAEK